MLKVSCFSDDVTQRAEDQLCRTAVRVRHFQDIGRQLGTTGVYQNRQPSPGPSDVLLRSYLSFGRLWECEDISPWETELRAVINRSDCDIKALQMFDLQKARYLLPAADRN